MITGTTWPSKMPRVLYIPELLDMIFGMLDPISNVANAVVCRQWSHIALDSLWRDVDNLHRLFAILAPLRRVGKDEYDFERLPDSEDWKRFEKYGKRVRRLVYRASPDSHKISQSVFDGVARTRTRLDILPNLHTLHWKAPLSLCVIFMHSGIRQFAVLLPSELRTVSPRPFFQDIAGRMPNLTSLDMRSLVPMSAIETETVNLLQQLPKLRKVTFPRFYLTSKVAETLSRLDHLGIIEFQYHAEQGCGKSADVMPFNPALSEGAFPALWDHSMTTSFEDAARFLDVPFAPTNLTMLYVDSEIMETPAAIYNMLCVVAENCQLLKFLALVSLRDSSSSAVRAADAHSDKYKITIDTLKPILKLPNLTSIEITHQFPLALQQEDIELLASSWPSMETLLLNNEPVQFSHSNLTLESLLPFSRHCPQLTHMGLFVDASHVMSPIDPSTASSLIPFQRLKKLSMGVSIITDENKVALYLSHILPLGCQLDSGITWDESDDVHPDVPMEVGERCQMWTKVARLLPVLIRLRIEERERTRAMEKELDDLRMRTGMLRDLAALGVRLDISTCVLI